MSSLPTPEAPEIDPIATDPGCIELLERDYGGGDEAPLRAYLAIMGIYMATCAALTAAAQREGRELPERIEPSDILLLGMASHKLSRLISSDWVAGPIRAPFTRFVEAAGAGEVREEPRGTGLQHAVGQLITCPFCLGVWIATCLTYGVVLAPRFTRLVSGIFSVVTVADFLQMAYGLTKREARKEA